MKIRSRRLIGLSALSILLTGGVGCAAHNQAAHRLGPSVTGVTISPGASVKCEIFRDDLSPAPVALLVCNLKGVAARERPLTQIVLRVHELPGGGGAAKPCCCVNDWCSCPDPVLDFIMRGNPPLANACTKIKGDWVCSPEKLLAGIAPGSPKSAEPK